MGLKKVKVIFRCDYIACHVGGDKTIGMIAIHDGHGANKDFTDATPSGALNIRITSGYPAGEFFKPGNNYILSITEDTELPDED